MPDLLALPRRVRRLLTCRRRARTGQRMTMMRVASITPVETEPALCIQVGSDDRLFTVGTPDAGMVTHNSVIQRNIVFGCVLRPQHWGFIGIDLKRVELGPYRDLPGVLGIAVTIEDAVQAFRFAHEVMSNRYKQMDSLNVQDYAKVPDRKVSIMVMMDEVTEATSKVTGLSSEEAKEENALKAELIYLWGSILRLGRAAAVHTVNATQRPDATKSIPGEYKNNMVTRVACGYNDPTASKMILGNANGSKVPGVPVGRLYHQMFSTGYHGQGIFAEVEWLHEFLVTQGFNPDGSSLEAPDTDAPLPPVTPTLRRRKRRITPDTPVAQSASTPPASNPHRPATPATPGAAGPHLPAPTATPTTTTGDGHVQRRKRVLANATDAPHYGILDDPNPTTATATPPAPRKGGIVPGLTGWRLSPTQPEPDTAQPEPVAVNPIYTADTETVGGIAPITFERATTIDWENEWDEDMDTILTLNNPANTTASPTDPPATA